MDPRTRMAHLLRRAGFGIAPGELEARLSEGYETTVERLVEAGSVPDPAEEVDRVIGEVLDFNNLDDVRTWWIYRMVHSGRPLVEKVALFWHGHFATSNAKVNNPFWMYQQNELFRQWGLSGFGDLLERVAIDPAMLVWLDGASNRKGQPNENFAREVMELFTFGPGHYSEKDVQEAARAFTGWELREGKPFFNPGTHDAGPKTFLGRTGNFDGSDVLRTLADHPATAERLTRKLFTFFVHDAPDAQTLAPFVEVWRKTRGSVREVLRAIFLSPAFQSERAHRAKIKSPAEFVIGSMRALGGTLTPRTVVSWMARMGQDLFNPPSVKGWDEGRAWISTSTLFERFNFAAAVTTQRGPPGTSHVDPSAVLQGRVPTSEAQLLELCAAHLIDGALTAGSREALLAYLETTDAKPGTPRKPFTLDPRMLDTKVRGLLHLLLSTPESQLH